MEDGPNQPNWDDLARIPGLGSVLDPRDNVGVKNALIDQAHWLALKSRIPAAGLILDFGCGVGRFASRIRGLDTTYVGVDQSLEMIRMASRKTQGSRVSFVHFDGHRLPFPKALFTTCVCCCVLQYHSKTNVAQAMIREIHRVLRPGGKLLLLEQVSASGKSSGSVGTSSSEADFLAQLRDCFEVKKIVRVRACQPSPVARCTLGRKRLPFMVVPLVARFELAATRMMSRRRLGRLRYYEVLFEAVARGDVPIEKKATE